MKIIIAGSRSITSMEHVVRAIELSGFKITEVVSGGAKGVDQLGEAWASINDIPIKPFKADWTRHGRQAGILRNIQMAKYADGLIAVWDGVSAGTHHMVREAISNKLDIALYRIDNASFFSSAVRNSTTYVTVRDGVYVLDYQI